jgi:hypothetical protein
LGIVYWRGAQILADMRDYKGSEESGRKALTVCEALVAEHPDNRDYRAELSAAETMLSLALLHQGHPGVALPHARRGAEIAEALAAGDPSNIGLQRVLLGSYQYLAQALASPNSPSMEDAAAAIGVYRKMLSLAGPIAVADVSDRRAAFEEAVILQKLGSALW